MTALLESAPLVFSQEPKTLALSELKQEDRSAIGEEICNLIQDKLDFQIFKQDYEVLHQFNNKIASISESLNQSADKVRINDRVKAISNLLVESSNKKTVYRVSGLTDSKNQFSLFAANNENKENQWNSQSLSNIDKVEPSLARNKVDIIPLDLQEREKLFADCYRAQNGGLDNLEAGFENNFQDLPNGQEGTQLDEPHFLDNLECSDEELPPPEAFFAGSGSNEPRQELLDELDHEASIIPMVNNH